MMEVIKDIAKVVWYMIKFGLFLAYLPIWFFCLVIGAGFGASSTKSSSTTIFDWVFNF